MAEKIDRLRGAVQKLTEAIWNLDQLEPLSPELKEQYDSIRNAREYLVKLLKNKRV
jgi:hypothetical protein